MGYAENLWMFTTLLVGIILVPGMDMVFVLANALTGGRPAGLAATGGIMAGGAAHSALSVTAIALLTRWMSVIYAPILLAGAAYMLWIGWTLIRSSVRLGQVGRVADASVRRALLQGFVTCMLNPKAYLFTMSVTPQFVKPEYGTFLAQGLVVGGLTVAVQGAIYGTLAVAAGSSRDLMAGHPGVTVWIGRACGVLFIAAAIWTAHAALTMPP